MQDSEPMSDGQPVRYLSVCLPLHSQFPDFLVDKDRTLSSLRCGWDEGSRFQMPFTTAEGSVKFPGVVAQLKWKNVLDLWECVEVQWNKSSEERECVNIWELEAA
eukprot:GHVO01040549.1.p1 GENE.GHVO01040549.1~~GHVO01040549.1.p1  ORF type:complete len:120 (-),score=19.75 GHVO01040549.1:64-378(-)